MFSLKIVRSVQEMLAVSDKLRKSRNGIGFVPTMGSFHEGHLSLLRASKNQCSKSIASIFVNPLQFGPNDDYSRYPRDEVRDIKLAKKEKIDYLFLPNVREMYPNGFGTQVLASKKLTTIFEGALRPGHFQGVTSVVAKLFNIVKPDFVYFGQKDAQQVAIIKQMIRDLNYDLIMKILPTAREKDGLAMSSRNLYLSPLERKAAPVLFRSLQFMQSMIQLGERQRSRLISRTTEMLCTEKLVKILYLDIVDPDNFFVVNKIKGKILAIVSSQIGKVKLIDNFEMEIK